MKYSTPPIILIGKPQTPTYPVPQINIPTKSPPFYFIFPSLQNYSYLNMKTIQFVRKLQAGGRVGMHRWVFACRWDNNILMYSSSQHPASSSKISAEPRSRTPNKNATWQFKQSHRESRSVARPEERISEAPPRMEAIKEWAEGVRYYYLGKGNNHEAVRRAINQRKGLSEASSSDCVLAFKWTQNSFGFKFNQLGRECLSFNHFQFHRELTNKQRLVWNMVSFCESNKLNAFAYIPTTFVIDLTTGEEELALHGFIKFYNRNLPEGHPGPRVHSILLPRSRYTPYQSAQQLHKRSQGNFYCKPTCPKSFFGNSTAYYWILKPTFMNRGRGISLFSSLSEFEKLIWKYYEGEGLEDYEDKQGIGDLYRVDNALTSQTIRIITDEEEDISKGQIKLEKQSSKTETKTESKQEAKSQIKQQAKLQVKQEVKLQVKEGKQNNLRVLSFVVQKYIQCPMLVNERKFDIRVWVVLTQTYEVYFFSEGYLRFSSHKYSLGDHKNPFIHLTNNSVQKHCNEYDEQSGNQITLSALRQHLPSETVYTKIQSKIREIVWLSMCSVRRKINVNGRQNCFELFGYDFMVDEAYKVWLIEVNTNPAIEQCSSVLKALIPRMLDDLFKLTLDKILNLRPIAHPEVYPVEGFADDTNMWQLLGDFREGANEKTLGKRMSLLRR